MLTANLVRAWRRGDRLFVRQMNRNELEEALEIAQAYIDIAMSHEGHSREDFDTRCAGVDIRVQDRKLAAGLLKLVHDRCVFEMFDDVDPVALHKDVGRHSRVPFSFQMSEMDSCVKQFLEICSWHLSGF